MCEGVDTGHRTPSSPPGRGPEALDGGGGASILSVRKFRAAHPDGRFLPRDEHRTTRG